MSYFNSRTNPFTANRPLKIVMLTTIILSLFTAISDAIFPYFFGIPSPQMWFSLSNWGLSHNFFWQIFSYFFISQTPGGLSIPFFLHLVFNMYFLWMVGSSVIQMKNQKDFLWLYVGGGIFTGIVMGFVIFFTHYPLMVAGATPALYCLLTAWMMLVPEIEILLFFTLPIKVKWLITGILGINLLIDISHGHFFNFILFLTPIIYGYFYSLLVWKTPSPFKIFHQFESFVIKQSERAQKNFYQNSRFDHSFAKNSKIYDFKTGKIILNDEDFMDTCLAKIALHGKNSLSFFERLRMKKISKKRKRNLN